MEINKTKHLIRKKVYKIPTFNSKFSLRGSSLADASVNHPGGRLNRPPGMGGELVVIEGPNQRTSATSSLADSQQQSSAISKLNKYKKHQEYFKNKKHNPKEPTHTHTQQHKPHQTHKRIIQHTAKTQI